MIIIIMQNLNFVLFFYLCNDYYIMKHAQAVTFLHLAREINCGVIFKLFCVQLI